LRDIEGTSEDGVCLLGLHDACAGLLGVLALRRGQQSGSDPDPFGTSHQGRSYPSWRGDATCHDHRHLHRVQHGLQQGKRTHLAGNMSPGFHSLDRDEINSVSYCLHRLGPRIDLCSQHNAVPVQPLHVGSGGTKRNGEQERSGLYRRIKQVGAFFDGPGMHPDPKTHLIGAACNGRLL